MPSHLAGTRQDQGAGDAVWVGDHCVDNTEEMLTKFKDKRIKFYNLPKRG